MLLLCGNSIVTNHEQESSSGIHRQVRVPDLCALRLLLVMPLAKRLALQIGSRTWVPQLDFQNQPRSCKPVKGSYWGMCRERETWNRRRCSVGVNSYPNSRMKLGGSGSRDRANEATCASPGARQMFSRGLRITWSRFQSIAADECKSSLFLWSRWLLILQLKSNIWMETVLTGWNRARLHCS